MGKRKRDNGISLDSFLDILTCLQGVLMLIIITTGIDAAQTKIIVATPVELAGDEKPIFIEVRNNQLFTVPLERARGAIRDRQKEIVEMRRSTGASTINVLEAVGNADVDIGDYVVDFARFLGGQIALIPKPESTGYAIESFEAETPTNWFGKIINEMDRDNERINFLVRDDSFDMFKLARLVAWKKEIKVTYSLIPGGEPLTFQ